MTRLRVTWRAAALIWAAHAQRARARLHAGHRRLVPALLVTAGMGGMLGGGALIGTWCLGLVLIGESAALTWVGLNRDDGTGRPRPGAGEGHTIEDVLERARWAP